MSESILQEAQRLVHGDRGAAYGHPADDYQATADMWRALMLRRYGVDVPLTPDFACLMMVAVKLSREAGKPKRDNRVDAAGYMECVDMCIERAEIAKTAIPTDLQSSSHDLNLSTPVPPPGLVVAVTPAAQAVEPEALLEEPE